MREIKFRFYCTGCKCWHYITLDELCDPKAKDFRVCHEAGDNASGFQQLIALQHSECREIYEGDIVECSHEQRGVVEYDDYSEGGGGFFPYNESTGGFCEICQEKHRWHYFTVIGNIHQNPELLEKA